MTYIENLHVNRPTATLKNAEQMFRSGFPSITPDTLTKFKVTTRVDVKLSRPRERIASTRNVLSSAGINV
jgi:hypothetical protein